MQYSVEQLKEILDKHQKWLNAFQDGERADLRSADLRSADLSGADLRRADLRSANLRSADLSGANLRSADLSGADLRRADLSGADLRRADLRSADLRRADLRSADLRSADLSGADLSGADLDYSCLPLHCGLIGMKIDKRIAAQVAFHFLRMACEDGDVKAVQHSEKIVALAKLFHRFEECGGLPETSAK